MAQHWVFAYGSNMHRGDLLRWHRRKRRPHPVIDTACPAVLHHYELVFNYFSPVRQGGAANVQPREGACVHGVALRLDTDTLANLDHKEGRPHAYDRSLQPLDVDGHGHVQAWVYEVIPSRRSPTFVAPHRDYLQLMLEAGATFGFAPTYLAKLSRTEAQESLTALPDRHSEQE